MKTAILCVAILALMQICLGLAISACRWKFKKSVGTPDDPGHIMKRISTAYSNCAEWHPMLYALLLIQPMSGGPAWAIWFGPLVVTARCLAVTGLVTFTLERPNPFRFVGAATTYVCSLALAILLVITHIK